MEGAPRGLCLLVVCLLPLLGNCTIVIDDELMALPKDELAAHISGLLSRPGALVQAEDLPDARPPVYWMCDYSCMKSVQISSSQGVFTLDMRQVKIARARQSWEGSRQYAIL